jgi:hypothetical protein
LFDSINNNGGLKMSEFILFRNSKDNLYLLINIDDISRMEEHDSEFEKDGTAIYIKGNEEPIHAKETIPKILKSNILNIIKIPIK